MSISAVLHSRPPSRSLPRTMEDAKAEFFDAERLAWLASKGKGGARLLGMTMLTALLVAYAPDTQAMNQVEPVNTVTMFMHAMEFAHATVPNSLQFVIDAAAAATDMAGAIAYTIKEDIVAPTVGTARTSTHAAMIWAAGQKAAIVHLGTSLMEAVREVADYLVPDTKGEMVERAIVAIAALKSFAEGVGVMMKGFRALSRKIRGEPATPPVAAPKPAQVEVHHHHHYGDAPRPEHARPVPPADVPIMRQVEDAPVPIPVVRRGQDAANDNDYGSPSPQG